MKENTPVYHSTVLERVEKRMKMFELLKEKIDLLIKEKDKLTDQAIRAREFNKGYKDCL